MHPCFLSLRSGLFLLLFTGCASRQVGDSLSGSTAQRLVTYGIDRVMDSLPEEDFGPLRGKQLWVESFFIQEGPLKTYADQRMWVALRKDFDIRPAPRAREADARLQVFYTSLGTDEQLAGFYLPLGVVPGLDNETRVNLITLEKFHGVVEFHYFLETGQGLERGATLFNRVRSDALGLPIITIPLSNLPEGKQTD